MSNIIDSEDQNLQIYQQENCRVSYILNNSQPVRCSIIGDQPLFYMDFEGDFIEDDDDDFTDLLNLEKLEHSIDVLREKTLEGTPYEASCLGGIAEEALKGFHDEADYITKSSLKKEGLALKKDLESLKNTLSKSRLAAAYLSFAKEQGVKLHYSRQVISARYDRADQAIFINPDSLFTDQLLLTARELRRVWQHKQGALIHPLTFHPDQAILVNRAQIADLMVNMVRIAWELQLSSIKEPWARIEKSPMADLAYAFARESYLDFRTINNGLASSAVFENWFLSDRCCHEDKRLIQQMLSDYNGYVFDTEQPSKQVTSDLIVALGSVPFGKNYLAPYVSTIIDDAIFTEVRDRSNANFLWFIKFERSFRETEQELQNKEDVCSRESLQGSLNKNYKGRGDDEKTADIISLPNGESSRPREQGKKARRINGQDGKIVYLQPSPEGDRL